jgi:uncharacterized membrane protein YcaP (DUF421 family)
VLSVAAGTVAMYFSTLVAVRMAGRRTLAQLSAFDAVITVAIGSLIASTAVSEDPSYAQGLTALVTLLTLQVIIGLARQRSTRFRRAVDFSPETVFEDRTFQARSGVTTAQITEDEIEAAMRRAGAFDKSIVRVVILEADGTFSVDTIAPGTPRS